MTNEELLTAVAHLVVGLGVPLSIGVPLGAARKPLLKLHSELIGIGYGDKDEVAEQLITRFSV